MLWGGLLQSVAITGLLLHTPTSCKDITFIHFAWDFITLLNSHPSLHFWWAFSETRCLHQISSFPSTLCLPPPLSRLETSAYFPSNHWKYVSILYLTWPHRQHRFETLYALTQFFSLMGVKCYTYKKQTLLAEGASLLLALMFRTGNFEKSLNFIINCEVICC